MHSLPAPMLPSEVERDYEILNPLGRHDRIETYLARRRADGVECVVRYERGGELTPRERRNLEESWVLLRRIRHCAFPEILQIGMPVSGGCYLIHRFVRGVNLRNLRRHLDGAMVREVLVQLIPALDLLHHHRLTHQRISPEKIIVEGLGPGCRVRLVDPPLSRAENGRRWAPPAYRAPEAEGVACLDGRADIYSLAVAIYEAMVGRHPFPPLTQEGAMYAARCRDLPPLRLPEELLPTALEDVLLRMGSTDPVERPVNALALYRDLRRRRQVEARAVEADLPGLLGSTRWMAFEPRVREVIAVLPREFRPVEIEAAGGLTAVAEEVGARLRLRRSRRLLRIRQDGTSERVSPAEGVPEKLVLTVSDDQETISRGTEAGVIRVDVRRGSVDDIRRRLFGLCLGPLDRRRSKLLAHWLTWRFGEDMDAIDRFLEECLLTADDHVLLDWIRIGTAILDSLSGIRRRRFRNVVSRFPTGIPLLDAKRLKCHCLTSEAAQLMARIFEEAPLKAGDVLGRARRALVVANHMEHAGRLQTGEKWRVRAASELAATHPGLMERILLAGARNTRTPRSEMANKYGLPVTPDFDPLTPDPDLQLHLARVLKQARELIFNGEIAQAELIITPARTLLTSHQSSIHPASPHERPKTATLRTPGPQDQPDPQEPPGPREPEEPGATLQPPSTPDEPETQGARPTAGAPPGSGPSIPPPSPPPLSSPLHLWHQKLTLEFARAAHRAKRSGAVETRLGELSSSTTVWASIEATAIESSNEIASRHLHHATRQNARYGRAAARIGSVNSLIASLHNMGAIAFSGGRTENTGRWLRATVSEKLALAANRDLMGNLLESYANLRFRQGDMESAAQAILMAMRQDRFRRKRLSESRTTTLNAAIIMHRVGRLRSSLRLMRKVHLSYLSDLGNLVYAGGHLLMAELSALSGDEFLARTTAEICLREGGGVRRSEMASIYDLVRDLLTDSSSDNGAAAQLISRCEQEFGKSKTRSCSSHWDQSTASVSHGAEGLTEYTRVCETVLWAPSLQIDGVLEKGRWWVRDLERTCNFGLSARLARLCAMRLAAMGWVDQAAEFLVAGCRSSSRLVKQKLGCQEDVRLRRFVLEDRGERGGRTRCRVGPGKETHRVVTDKASRRGRIILIRRWCGLNWPVCRRPDD